MKLQIHALRFCTDDDERALRKPINSNPAEIIIEPGSDVSIYFKDGVVHTAINGQASQGIVMGPWDYTAICLVVDIPE